jgi:hypothetical protein
MQKYIRTISPLILTGFLACFFYNCKKTSEQPDTQLVLTIMDDTNAVANGSKVYLYDNYSVFLASWKKTNPAIGALDSVIGSNGNVTFSHLSKDKDYWIHVTYFVPPKSFYNNRTGMNSISPKLASGSTTFAEIKLNALGEVGFYTLGANNNKLPITVFINSDTFQLSNTITAAPSAPGPNVLTIFLTPGTYTYEAKGAMGCLWTNQITVAKKTFIAERLDLCIRGTISFYTGSNNASMLPITVVLNNKDNVGNITQTINASGGPVKCNDPGTISTIRDPNFYTYSATSAAGGLLWTGNFSFSKDTCIVINLP